MSAHIQQASMASGRSLVFMVIVALHAVAISALMAWRISEATSENPHGLVVSWPDPPPQDIPKPVANGSPLQGIPLPNPVAPRPVVSLPEEPVLSLQTVQEVPVDTGSSDVGLPVAVADTPLRFQAVRPADDYYPPNAIRLEQQGTVIVRTCVDASGRLTSAPQVVTGSRFRLLDEAAIVWAGEALRFTPATKGGTAVGACKEFRVNFRLH